MSRSPETPPELARALRAAAVRLYPIGPSHVACVPNGSQFDCFVGDTLLRVTIEQIDP